MLSHEVQMHFTLETPGCAMLRCFSFGHSGKRDVSVINGSPELSASGEHWKPFWWFSNSREK